MNLDRKDLVEDLANKVTQISGRLMNEIERNCWIVVHEYHHGVRPSEYDIREIDEDLYLLVLKRVREIN